MSAVGVLDWLDSLHATTADGAVTNRKWPEAQAARAAVAEVIGADKEYDAASEAWESAPGNIQAIGDTDGRDFGGPEYRRLVIAIERRRVALANVGGAS